jgi:hypothetical protein
MAGRSWQGGRERQSRDSNGREVGGRWKVGGTDRQTLLVDAIGGQICRLRQLQKVRHTAGDVHAHVSKVCCPPVAVVAEGRDLLTHLLALPVHRDRPWQDRVLVRIRVQPREVAELQATLRTQLWCDHKAGKLHCARDDHGTAILGWHVDRSAAPGRGDVEKQERGELEVGHLSASRGRTILRIDIGTDRIGSRCIVRV